MNIYVSNVSFHTSEADLETLFSKFGAVKSVKMITDKFTGQPRGFGFVEMETENEGNDAILGLNNKVIEGRSLAVSVARERTERAGGNSRDNNRKW